MEFFKYILNRFNYSFSSINSMLMMLLMTFQVISVSKLLRANITREFHRVALTMLSVYLSLSLTSVLKEHLINCQLGPMPCTWETFFCKLQVTESTRVTLRFTYCQMFLQIFVRLRHIVAFSVSEIWGEQLHLDYPLFIKFLQAFLKFLTAMQLKVCFAVCELIDSASIIIVNWKGRFN